MSKTKSISYTYTRDTYGYHEVKLTLSFKENGSVLIQGISECGLEQSVEIPKHLVEDIAQELNQNR